MEQVLKIATTVNHAEIQERRDETFYVDKARASGIQTDLHADSEQREKHDSTCRG
jgi:hypothetical protein